MSNSKPESCKRCGWGGAIRHIKMMEGSREYLCEDCFKKAFDEGEVHPSDPRVETRL